MVAIVVSFGFVLLFLFVPETFWDRTPRPKSRRPAMGHRSISNVLHHALHPSKLNDNSDVPQEANLPRQHRPHIDTHVGFMEAAADGPADQKPDERSSLSPVLKPSPAQLQPASVPETPHWHNPNSSPSLELERSGDYPSHRAEPQQGTASRELVEEKLEE